MARRILRHAEQGAIFREGLVSELAQGLDPSQGGVDLGALFEMLHEHFSDVGENLTDVTDAMEGGHDLAEAKGEGLDGVHYTLPHSPAGMALLSGGELGRQWSNSAKRFIQQHQQQHGQLPQPHHLMQHAQGWAAANVLPYVNPEMHKYINPQNALPSAHQPVAPPPRQGPPRDRYDEAFSIPSGHSQWADTMLNGPPKKKHRFFGAAPANRYLLLPHWDPHACVQIMLDHHEDMARHHQASRRTAGYSVELKLHDGTTENIANTPLFPDARKQADDLAAKHKLYLKEMSRSPDDWGRTPMWLPAYAEGDKFVGNVKIDRAEADHTFNPYGPHSDQYAYASKRLALPVATPELMNMAKGGGFTLHDHVGDGPTTGYMVSRNKNTEHALPMSQLTPKLVNDYVHQHVRELASPENYLGGWLDGKNFYLDISSHRPTIDRAAADAVGADQLGIYDLGKGETIYTPDAVEQSGDIGLAYKPRPKDPLTAAVIAAVERQPGPLPDHDYLQHHLGDAEHWMEDSQLHTAATPGQGFEDVPKGVQYAYDHPKSSHGAKVYKDPAGNSWLIKHPPNKASIFLVDGDLATAHIQHLSGLETPATFKTDVGHGPASAQYMYDATDAFPDDEVDPDAIAPEDKMIVQKHHALDWLMGNHDSHSRQFVRTKDTGKVIGIDKTQSFKHFAQDILHWNFHPNSVYNEKEPIYNTLYRHMARGGTPLFDPRDGELGKYVQGLQEIPDQEYADILRPYAEGAAKAGQLAKAMPEGYYQGFQHPPRFPQNHVEDFLNAVVERKNRLMDHLGDLWDRAKAHADTGTKLAKVAAAPTPFLPSPAEMEISLNQPGDLGSHGSLVHTDKTGSKWLVKTPQAETEFMVPLDVGIGALMAKVGLKSPPIHAVPMQGHLATAVKWIPNAQQVWKEPPSLAHLAAKDLLAIQKHHALDWLIANHDSHVGNWLRDGDGDLIGIDKGQAMKYFGRDRLSSSFHPNYYAREPIYNNLWREYSAGHGQMLDPREGRLGAFVQALQDIPDEVYAGLFAPYAHAAAHAGVLATGSTKGRPIELQRKLGAPTVAENDPDAFLQALVARKHDLMHDLGTYYDKMTARRQKYLGSHHGDD
jgi:hypothetical protein